MNKEELHGIIEKYQRKSERVYPSNEEKAALDEVRQSDLACPARTVALTEEAAKLWLLAGGELYAVCDSENVIPGLKGNEKSSAKREA
jgi:hypothetical protein